MRIRLFVLISAMLLVTGCVYYPYGEPAYSYPAYYAYPDYSLSFNLNYPYYYPHRHPYYYGNHYYGSHYPNYYRNPYPSSGRYPGGSHRPGPFVRR